MGASRAAAHRQAAGELALGHGGTLRALTARLDLPPAVGDNSLTSTARSSAAEKRRKTQESGGATSTARSSTTSMLEP
jgi:hypothetical protein